VRESAEDGLKLHRPVQMPVPRRAWRHPLEQPLHAGGFWRHQFNPVLAETSKRSNPVD
jgi:hypothetical protein